MRYTFFLLMALAVCQVSSAKKKQSGMKKVYCFGFVSSFTDSLAYLTDVQQLDSTYVTSKGLLPERTLYSLQLYGYANEKRGMAYPTTAFFFSQKPQKLAKKYQKVKRLYMENPDVKLVMLTRDDFMFTPEEHYESLIEEEQQPEPKSKKELKAEKKAAKAAAKEKKEAEKAKKGGKR